MRPMSLRIAALFLVVSVATAPTSRAETKTLARCGAGFLEEVDGYRVLHVKGEPYEMGYQQGALLRDDIRESIRFLFEVKAKELKVELAGLKLLDPKRAIKGIAAGQRKFVPERFFDEMRGIADGAGLDVQDIVDRQFHPRAVPLFGFRAQRHGDQRRNAVPRSNPRLRLRLAAPGTRGPDGRRAPRQDSVRERDLRGLRRLGHGHERRTGLDRRDGRARDGPLGRCADGLPGPDGPGRSRHARSRHRDLSRQSAHL